MRENVQRGAPEVAVTTAAASPAPTCVVVHRLVGRPQRQEVLEATGSTPFICLEGQFFFKTLGKITFTVEQVKLSWSGLFALVLKQKLEVSRRVYVSYTLQICWK